MDIKALVIEEAAKSICNKRKVGAIIVNKADIILSSGHNINLSVEACEDTDGNTVSTVMHAEISALSKLLYEYTEQEIPDILKDATMFISHPPCNNCLRAIEEHNLKYIVIDNFIKFDKDKLKYNLIPPVVIKELAKILTFGAKKYKPNNWKNVDDKSRYIDALYRHLEAWRAGEQIDDDSGESHLSHAITNLAFLVFFEKQED